VDQHELDVLYKLHETTLVPLIREVIRRDLLPNLNDKFVMQDFFNRDVCNILKGVVQPSIRPINVIEP
jgi:hypothetical protein